MNKRQPRSIHKKFKFFIPICIILHLSTVNFTSYSVRHSTTSWALELITVMSHICWRIKNYNYSSLKCSSGWSAMVWISYKKNSFNWILPPCKRKPGWTCSMDFIKWLGKIFVLNDNVTTVGLTQETDNCRGNCSFACGAQFFLLGTEHSWEKNCC